MPIRTITITRNIPSQQVSGGIASYQMAIVASGAVGMPNEIFLMNLRPLDPHAPSGPAVSDFQSVCVPYDIQTYSINNPASGQSLYRVATFSAYYATLDDAEQAWEVITSDVQFLKDSLDANDRLIITETFVPS